MAEPNVLDKLSDKAPEKKGESEDEEKKEDVAIEPEGTRCEVKNLMLRTKDGEIKTVERDAKTKNEDPYNSFALVSKQSYDEHHKLTGTTLEINSPQVLAMLKAVVQYYPGDPLDFSSKVTIEAP